jgi:CheY-like chemotaxis protein
MNSRLVIVDDDPMFCMIHKMVLHSSGISVNPVLRHNGQETLSYLDQEAESGKQFLIFLDINMPVMTGWEFLDELQSRSYTDNVFVVMITSSINPEDRSKAESYPQVIRYIEKPLEFEDVDQFVEDPLLRSFLPSEKSSGQ